VGKNFLKKVFPHTPFQKLSNKAGQGELADFKYGFIRLWKYSLAETAEMRYTWGMKPVSAFFYSKENFI